MDNINENIHLEVQCVGKKTEEQLKERTLRKKEKKTKRKLERQKKREEKELVIQLQPRSNNVKLITRDLANKVVGNISVSALANPPIDNAEFPELGTKCKLGSQKKSSIPLNNESDTGKERRDIIKVQLYQFLSNSTTTNINHVKQVDKGNTDKYSGNPLDSDLPLRKKGKCREIPKLKKCTKLKQEILQDRKVISEDPNSDTLTKRTFDACDNIITEQLNNLTKSFISLVVERQEKLYKRDTIKGTSRRKYIVGLHETRKYLNLNKVKMLIIASDIQIMKQEDALDKVIKQLITLVKANNVPHLFALKRRSLGVLTLKYIPVSCIAILNYEGLESHFNNLIDLTLHLKEDYQKIYKSNVGDSHSEEDINICLLNNLKEALTSVT